MPYSKVEKLTDKQQLVHNRFTNYLTSVVGLKTPNHQTESLERRVQVFVREKVDSSFTCVYDYQDISFLESLIGKIKNDSEWNVYNQRHAGTITRSLQHYIDFLQNTVSGGIIKENKIVNVDSYKEGKVSYVHAVGYERNQEARKACIAYYGCKCSVCGFDFEKTYGEIGKDFIEVHHIIPIHERKGEYKVDPVRDLRPLCSNCHSMVHRRNPVFSIDELETKLMKQSLL